MSDYSINATIGADGEQFDKAIKKSIAGLESFATYFEKAGDSAKLSFTNIATQFTAIDAKAKVWGNTTDVLADKQKALKNEINSLIDKGLTPEDVKIKALKASYDNLEKSQVKSTSATKTMWQTFASLRDIMQGPVAAIQMLGSALQGIGAATVGKAGTIEDMVAAFTPLTGGADNARAMVEALNKEAATTPFELEGIGRVAKQLLPVFGNDVGAVTDAFRMLGDTAGGNIEKLDSITRGYMKTMMKGKVDMESMNMIAEAGVPIYTELADSMGVSVAEMTKMSSAGKITSDDMTKAFQKMTSEGGIFFNGMQVASQTLSGKLSTMSDSLSMAGVAIGNVFLPMVKSLADFVSSAAGAFTEWATEGNNLATVFKMIAAIGISAMVAGVVSSIPALLTALAAIKASIMAINTTALFGPTGIIIGLGMLVAAFIALADSNHQNVLKGIEKEFGELAKQAGMSAEKIFKVEEAIANASKGGGTFEETAAFIKQASEDLGITEAQVVAIGLKSSKVTAEYKTQLQLAGNFNKERAEGEAAYAKLVAESKSLVVGTKEWIDKQAAAQKILDDSKKKAQEAEKKRLADLKLTEEAQIAGRKKATTEYTAQIDTLNQKRKAGLMTEDEYAKAFNSATNKQIDALLELGYTFDDTKSIGGKALNSLKESLIEVGKEAGKTEVIIQDGLSSVSTGMITHTRVAKSAFQDFADQLGNYWQKTTTELINKSKDWSATFDTIKNALKTGIYDSLENIGTILATGEGWNNFKTIALTALAAILEAFGAQLLAMAAAKALLGDWAGAAIAAAAGAAAFVAAGAAKAWAATAKETKEAATAAERYNEAMDTTVKDTQSLTEKLKILNTGAMDINIAKSRERIALLTEESKPLIANVEAIEKEIQARKDAGIYMGIYDSTAGKHYWALRYLAENTSALAAENLALAASESYKANVIKSAEEQIAASIDDTNDSIEANIQLFTDAQLKYVSFNSMLLSIRNSALSFAESLKGVGTQIASSLIDNLSKGLGESDFLQTMKEYITNMVVQAAIYTDALSQKMASIGQRIAEGIASGFTGESLQGIKDELSALYQNAAASAKVATDIVGSIFPAAAAGAEGAGYATGTAYASAGWHMVGEQGPERVYLPQGASVLNAAQTRSGGGTKNITLAPVFNSPKAMNQIEQMRALRQYQRDLAFEGVI